MDNQGKSGRFTQHRILLGALLLTFVCCGLCYALTPRARLITNRALWKLLGPTKYYMEVYESRSDGGFWRWAVYVQNSHVLSVQLLSVSTHGYPEMESWLDPGSLTVEQVFTAANQLCADRGFLDCGLEFDSRFHYPKHVDSYELIMFGIIQFVQCEKVPGDCPPEP